MTEPTVKLYLGDCLEVMKTLDSESVQCCVTSPPYWGLRDYDVDGQLGLESTPEAYVAKLVDVFREVRRVLRDDGTLWLVLGDSYARNGGEPGGGNRELLHMEGKQKRMMSVPDDSGLKPKDLVGIPWRVAFALQTDGWYLRSDIIWAKPNPMPESVIDRPTKSHEYVFLLAKQGRYYYDAKAVAERGSETSHGAIVSGPGWKAKLTGNHSGSLGLILSGTRNRRTVWTVTTSPYKGAHFAVFPPKLVEPMILAGCPIGNVVLDTFCGSGTTGAVSVKLGRSFIGIELKQDYIELAQARIAEAQAQPQLPAFRLTSGCSRRASRADVQDELL